MTIPFSTRAEKSSEVLMQNLEGESVFLHLQRGEYFGLDEVATRIWETLVSSASIQAAYDSLLEAYDVDPERLRRDVEVLLDKLVKHGLVTVGTS
jgi:hypothetical protein